MREREKKDMDRVFESQCNSVTFSCCAALGYGKVNGKEREREREREKERKRERAECDHG